MFEFPTGSYIPLDTPIHRADPSLKLWGFIGMILLASLGKAPGKVIVFIAALILARLSQISFRDLIRSLRSFLPFMSLILLMNGLFFRGEHVIREFWIFCISREGILQGLSLISVMAELIILSLILRRTTTPLELTGAVVKALSPLKIFGLKTDDLALVLSVSLQFIPVLMEESRTIIRAQRARGAIINEGSLMDRARSVLPLAIPIFLSAFRRADELSQALLARGYKE